MSMKTVLIADDDASIRLLVKKFLSTEYVVLEAKDGEEVVDLARNLRPDLILLDFMMPKLDGVGACCIIKSVSATSEIPVIMMSAGLHKLDQEYATSMGVDGYITKPFNRRELLMATHEFLPDAEISRGD